MPLAGTFLIPQLLNYTAVIIHRPALNCSECNALRPLFARQPNSPSVNVPNLAEETLTWAPDSATETPKSYPQPRFTNYTLVITHSWG